MPIRVDAESKPIGAQLDELRIGNARVPGRLRIVVRAAKGPPAVDWRPIGKPFWMGRVSAEYVPFALPLMHPPNFEIGDKGAVRSGDRADATLVRELDHVRQGQIVDRLP